MRIQSVQSYMPNYKDCSRDVNFGLKVTWGDNQHPLPKAVREQLLKALKEQKPAEETVIVSTYQVNPRVTKVVISETLEKLSKFAANVAQNRIETVYVGRRPSRTTTANINHAARSIGQVIRGELSAAQLGTPSCYTLVGTNSHR